MYACTLWKEGVLWEDGCSALSGRPTVSTKVPKVEFRESAKTVVLQYASTTINTCKRRYLQEKILAGEDTCRRR